jgi:hypothetical protein
MSYNSNGGYGNLNPYVVSGQFTNPNNSSYAGSFGSNETQGGAICNDAMMRGGKWGKGGKRGNWKESIRRKIKNITRKYKMGSKRSVKRMKSRIKSRYIGRSRSVSRSRYGGKKRRITNKSKKAQRGGNYSQFMNNLPNTPSYSLGSLLSSAASGLASPPPFNQLPNCTNCVDNYNHYTKMGSSSLGH